MSAKIILDVPARKKCTKCHTWKSVDDYYRHPRTGTLGQCKECCKDRDKKYRKVRKLIEPPPGMDLDGLPLPVCHGYALQFGSDPMTGRSLQFCAVCGERPVPQRGERSHDQRERLQAELTERAEGARRAPDPVMQARGTRNRAHGRGMAVIGRALQDQINAA